MKEKYLENKKCEICNQQDYKILYKWKKEQYNHNKYETCSWDGRQKINLRIVQCKNCGLIYTNPSFKEKNLNLIYPPNIIPNQIKKPKKNKKIKSLIKIILKHKQSGTLLDIGTRYGFFPYFAKKHGFDSYGIEYNPEAVKKGKKYFKKIYEGSSFNLEKVLKKNKLKKPNIVVMDDVLEHLVHPKEDVKKISKIQKKGDILVSRQMNYNSLGRKLFKRHWYYFAPAAHQFYFDEKSVKKLLKQTNYKLIKIYKMNLLKNFILTIFFRIPVIILINIYYYFKKNKKTSYLIKRMRSYDDMFTIVAEKLN
ncbi:MAG: class I SAM-dependent methyltransferase [archaeon]